MRPGNDVTLISYSRMVNECLQVATKLAGEKIEAEVIDLRTISPFDAQCVLTSVARPRRAGIVHEAVTPFGVGAEIASQINEALFGQLAARVERVGANYSPVPFSKVLETAFVPGQAQIEAAVRRTLGQSP